MREIKLFLAAIHQIHYSIKPRKDNVDASEKKKKRKKEGLR